MTDSRLESDAYRVTWRRIRRARLAVLITFLAWLPLHALLRALTGSVQGWLYLTMPLVAGILVASSVAIGYTRCPRCREYFARHPVKGRHPLTARCLHCGLPQWSRPDGASTGVEADRGAAKG
jgi:hypothetical protein